MEAGTPTDGKPWRLAWFRALVGGSQTEASLSVHDVHASVSLPPNEALRAKLFSTVSHPSPPSQRRSPHAISHGFLSVHDVHASASLL